MVTVTRSKRQLAWVFDLNKCIGCQTCSVACKVLWPQQDPGTEQMWWMTVNTQPGRGTPRDWEVMGGGYDKDGKLKLGKLPTKEEIGGGCHVQDDDVIRIPALGIHHGDIKNPPEGPVDRGGLHEVGAVPLGLGYCPRN